MRVISLGKENLDIELSVASYRICGDLGGGTGTGFSAFAEQIYKITEEHPMPMERRIRLANILSGVPAFSGDKLISDLRDPDFPYTTNLADIDEGEKNGSGRQYARNGNARIRDMLFLFMMKRGTCCAARTAEREY